jgi:preprotein translocase subunit SecA
VVPTSSADRRTRSATGEGVIEPGDFTVDEKTHQVYLTEDGHENAERLLHEAGILAEGASLYDPPTSTLMHHVTPRCVRTHCTTAISITWCRTART